MVKVKICGIKRLEDALVAIAFGADAVGLLVGQKHASPDFISPEAAQKIVEKLPPFCSSVLVTHLSSAEEITPLAKQMKVTTIQLHGEASPQEVKVIKKELPYIKTSKAIHITGQDSISLVEPYLDVVDAILLDTINVDTNQVGGTGKTHDWCISRKIVEAYNIPVILAGGLNPDNIKEAIAQVQPYGVDANSGTKAKDGFKDRGKLKLFIQRAKGLM